MTVQIIDNKVVYVVDFDEMPQLPIRGFVDEPESIWTFLSTQWSRALGVPIPRGRHAQALEDAIRTGIITEPGKYAIHLVPSTSNYEIYKVEE